MAIDGLSKEEVGRIVPLLQKDQIARSRSGLDHSAEIIERNCVAVYSIWQIPNQDAREVIDGKVGYDDLLYNDNNEVQKGMLFEDLRTFQKKHEGKPALCEAQNYAPCRSKDCPIFNKKQGVCGEFKVAY